jgi:hypothetical protein
MAIRITIPASSTAISHPAPVGRAIQPDMTGLAQTGGWFVNAGNLAIFRFRETGVFAFLPYNGPNARRAGQPPSPPPGPNTGPGWPGFCPLASPKTNNANPTLLMTRNGKIARLPRAICDQFNQRLENGGEGKALVEWRNSSCPPCLQLRWIKAN